MDIDPGLLEFAGVIQWEQVLKRMSMQNPYLHSCDRLEDSPDNMLLNS